MTDTPVTARRPPRNWYLSLLRVQLVVCALVITFSGTLYVWQAAYALNIFGSVLERDCVSDQALNNIWRHISVFWLSLAPVAIMIAFNLERFAPMLALHTITLFVAGCSRFWTAYTWGIPGTPMGYFLVYITTFFDLTSPIVAYALFKLGMKKRRWQQQQCITTASEASVEQTKTKKDN